MSWHKLELPVLNQLDVRHLKLSMTIVQLAIEADKKAGRPEDFAIFNRWEFADEGKASFVLYFSPVAASNCLKAGLPGNLTPCQRPDINEPGLGLSYFSGDSYPWDLLK